MLELDSTFCKVHQSACSGRKDQAIGSSRGGKNTKVHVLINEKMQLLKVVLTGGNIHDSEATVALLKGIKIKNYRHIATRYDKLALCFENFVLLASFVIHF